jgi:hypothetical protein
LLILLTTHPSKPLSCVGGRQTELSKAAKICPLVFSGKVVKTTRVESKLGDGFLTIIYKIVPTKIWRGAVSDTITLEGNSCSYKLENEVNYVLLTDSKLDSRYERIVSVNLETEASQLDKLFTKRRFTHFQPTE